MHSLPVLLIALALLPLAAPLKCHTGESLTIGGLLHKTGSEEKPCPAEGKTCGWQHGSDAQATFSQWGCFEISEADCRAKPCAEAKQIAISRPGQEPHNLAATSCCCVGDLCNDKGDAPKPPGIVAPKAPKCHVGEKKLEDSKVVQSESKEESCPDSNVCVWTTVKATDDGVLKEGTMWTCGEKTDWPVQCGPKLCVTKNVQAGPLTIPFTLCCCDGDLCNGKGDAPKPPGPAASPPSGPSGPAGPDSPPSGPSGPDSPPSGPSGPSGPDAPPSGPSAPSSDPTSEAPSTPLLLATAAAMLAARV